MQTPRRKTGQECWSVRDGGRKGGRNLAAILVVGGLMLLLVLGILIYNEEDIMGELTRPSLELELETPAAISNEEEEGGVGLISGCDIFSGEWVFDEVSRPLYKEEECRLLSAQVTCLKNGRNNSLYQNWRWQPKQCSLPRFNPKLLLKKLRNKRLMFVGDSLNRNQWESMVCMAQSGSATPNNNTITTVGSLTIFRIQDYNATIEFYWAPFLVESNSDHPSMHSIPNRIIFPNSINRHAQHWKGVHFLIFNSYIWWLNTPTIKLQLRARKVEEEEKGSSYSSTTEYDEEVERTIAYGKVLKTWANWVDQNVDPNLTRVFFNTMSPMHIRSTDWNNPNGVKCAKEYYPISSRNNTSTALNVGTDWRLFDIALKVTQNMEIGVNFMNITTLSQYRKEAHTSIYTTRQGKLLTSQEKQNPLKYADCIHWCLPGLPDTWNELIYARIISHSS